MSRKGFIAIGLLMIIQLVAMIMVFITITQFKVSITSIAVDVENINRYQNIPTTILADTVTMGDSPAASGYMDLRLRAAPVEDQKTNCFEGDGPVGRASQGEDSCKRRTTFFFTKFANDLGGGILSNAPHSLDPVFSSQDTLIGFADNLVMSLPFKCYEVSFLTNQGKADLFSDNSSTDIFGSDCGREERDVKLRQTYPIPYFSSKEPMVGENSIKIFVQRGGESYMLTWPKYNVKFNSQEGPTVNKPLDDPTHAATEKDKTALENCQACTEKSGMGYAIETGSCLAGDKFGSSDASATTEAGNWAWVARSDQKSPIEVDGQSEPILLMSCEDLPREEAEDAK